MHRTNIKMDKLIKIYTNWDGHIVIWTRVNNKRDNYVITNFKPYYWKLLDNGKYEKVFYNWKDKDAIDLTDSTIKEADMLPHKLYLLENEPEFEDKYKTLYYDIETKDTSGGVIIGAERILSICCVDNEGKEFVFCEDDEEKLLRKFKDLLLQYDIMVDWNGTKFDRPYLIARFKQYNIRFNFHDINHLDLMKIAMKSYIVQRVLSENFVRSYSLESIAKLFLKETKLEDEQGTGYGGRIFSLFTNDRATLIKYNLQDAKLLKLLNEELHLIENQIELSRLSCVNIEDTVYQSRMVDMLILKNSKTSNIHFPSIQRNLVKSNYPGGICEAIPGLYKNVATFDFQSMYISLIRTFNISPEMVADDNSVGDYYITFNGTKFKKERGIVTKILDELIEYRFLLRDEQKKYPKASQEYLTREIKQIAIKILCLSFYGCLGSNFTRYFSVKLACAITQNSQELMKEIIQFVAAKGHTFVAADTDSNFIAFRSLDDIAIFEKDVAEFINTIVKRQTNEDNKYMIFQLERVYSKFIIIAKKKYCGLVVAE